MKKIRPLNRFSNLPAATMEDLRMNQLEHTVNLLITAHNEQVEKQEKEPTVKLKPGDRGTYWTT